MRCGDPEFFEAFVLRKTMNELSIYPESEIHYQAVHDLIVEVFRETYGSGEAEAAVVEKMRQQLNLGPCVSLVAVLNDELVGHVFFSPVHLADFPDVPVCTLGPVGVCRQWQKQGIGTRLIQDGLAECRKHAYRAVFTTGSLRYYPRFGFVPIGETNLRTIFGSDHDMVLDLQPGTLERVSGLVEYPEPWHVFLKK